MCNICIMGIPEEENETTEILEAIMTEKSLKLMSETKS